MQRRQFVGRTTALAAAPAIYGVSQLLPQNVLAKLNPKPIQRWETSLAIYEKNIDGSWITLKPGTSMAMMTQEVQELELPFSVLAKENGEFALKQVKITNGLTQLHGRAFSPSRLFT